jgi:hypothetical protein
VPGTIREDMMRIKRMMAAALFVSAAGGAVFGEGLEFSGTLDSKVLMRAGAGEAPDFSYGLEEYANLRMQAKLRGGITFYGALNLIAAAGAFAEEAAALETYTAASPLPFSSFAVGENYAAALEPERLYLRVNGEYLDGEVGLMRLAFGYGQVWGPSDFLNPKNPLLPDARPRAVLGASLEVYPGDTAKLTAFGAAPKNPLQSGGGGFITGLSADQHWNRLSLQGLYAFEVPRTASPYGIHRAGLSIKADLALGLTADMLYSWDPGDSAGMDGLSASAGFDYSFYQGKWYCLAEYLYSGASSVTAGGALSDQSPEDAAPVSGLRHRHYLYLMFLYRWSDYTNTSLACMASPEDLSFTPILSVEHELFQGLTLSLRGQIALDRDVFAGNGKKGEFGPIPPGYSQGQHFQITANAGLRF